MPRAALRTLFLDWEGDRRRLRLLVPELPFILFSGFACGAPPPGTRKRAKRVLKLLDHDTVLRTLRAGLVDAVGGEGSGAAGWLVALT